MAVQPDSARYDLVGMTSAFNPSPGGSQAKVVAGKGQTPGAAPTSLAGGVTPGAVERRLSPPPQAQMQQAFAGGRNQVQNTPNLAGPAPAAVRAPAQNIQTFLEALQRRNQR